MTPQIPKFTAVSWAMHRSVPLTDATVFLGTPIATPETVDLHHRADFEKATRRAFDRQIWDFCGR